MASSAGPAPIVSRLAYGAMTFTLRDKDRPALFKTNEAAVQGVIAALARKPGEAA